MTQTRKQIARHDYRNGGWGRQSAALYRENGRFVFYNGWADGAVIVSPVEAKRAFREFVAAHPADACA